MNFTILIFLCLFSFLALWLSAKYLGKFGLGVFSIVTYTLSLVLGGLTVSALSAAVSVGTVFFISSVFSLYMLIKKYGLKEGVKILSVIFGVIILYYIFMLLVNLYFGALFFASLWDMFIGMLLDSLALVVGFGLVYWLLSIQKLFKNLNQEFKEFLVMLIGLFAFAFISVFLGQIGEVSFVQMLLNWLVTYLVFVIFLAVFFVCDRFIIIEENVTFGDNADEKLSKAVEKTKNAIIKKGKAKPEEPIENEEDDDFDFDDDDDFDFDFDNNQDILPNKTDKKDEEVSVSKAQSGVIVRQRPRAMPERMKQKETSTEQQDGETSNKNEN